MIIKPNGLNFVITIVSSIVQHLSFTRLESCSFRTTDLHQQIVTSFGYDESEIILNMSWNVTGESDKNKTKSVEIVSISARIPTRNLLSTEDG
jgi:hypothetical protein